MQYIAFLRGINLGKRQVKMGDLQKIFVDLGFTEVKTLIATGNVIFETDEQNEEVLRVKLETVLEKRFAFSIPVILRTKREIEKLLELNPFKEIATPSARNDGSKVRLQVTLFGHMINGRVPIKQNGFEIVYIGKRDIASIVYPDGKTTELMTYVDKIFGKNSTTRNWNTIQKLIGD